MITKQLWSSLLLVSCFLYQMALADDSNNVCKRVQGNVGKKSLLCVGKMRSTLLIITRDFHFYQIPMTTVNGTIDKLYLGNYPAKAIKDAWPKLWVYKPFQALVANPSLILDAYTITDSIDEYVLFETTTANNQYCTLYGINNQYVSQGTWYIHPDRNLCLLSSDKMNNYYQLTRNDAYMSGSLTIMRWVWSGDNIKEVVKLRDRRSANPQHKDFWRMCADGSNKVRVESNANAQCKSVDWPVLTGFQANGQFYLFGANYIFTFPEAAYDKPGSPVGLKKTPYDSFIQCGGKADARDLQVSKKSPTRFGLIVAIILILVILLLCCLLCLIREALARRKKANKEDKEGGSSSFFTKPSGAGGSARSVGLPGVAALSRKISGNPSKRSKSLPAAGELTKKPSRASSRKGSKRPTGAGSLTRKGTSNSKHSKYPSARAGNPIANKADHSGTNNVTDRSGMGRHGHGGSKRKVSGGRTKHSNRATERSKMKKK